jgi:cysteine-rich repeat protein
MADGDACTAEGDTTIEGHCLDSVCLPSDCGDSIIELGEMCDDGNRVDDETCSADCASTLKCGNGVTDAIKNEQCDDGNALDHDGCSSSCLTEFPRWIQHVLRPGSRSSAAYAYDSRRHRMVVFGGIAYSASDFVQLGDTIEWTRSDWVRIATASQPPNRYDAAMAYDAARGVSVMFGGFDGTFDLSDTWLWDGDNWHATNQAGPLERYGHVMVYDPKREVIVLFGGWNDQAQQLDDTWEWDGASWKQIDTPVKPSRREAASGVYDPRTGTILVVGGYNNDDGVLTDTWSYDGTTWTQVGTAPELRSASIAYDTIGQRVLLYGGINNDCP